MSRKSTRVLFALQRKKKHAIDRERELEYHKLKITECTLSRLINEVLDSFPLLDEEGLDPNVRHCECIQQERKRLHSIITKFQNQNRWCMTNYEMTYEDCVKMVKGMKRMPDSPAHFSVYCCKDSSVCIKMNDRELIIYYNTKEEFEGREDLLPFAFKNELTFNIKWGAISCLTR